MGKVFGDDNELAAHPLLEHTEGELQVVGETDTFHARDAGTLESNVALENAAAVGADVAWIVDDGAGEKLGDELRCRDATKIGKFSRVKHVGGKKSWGIYTNSTGGKPYVVVYLVGITVGSTMEVENIKAREADIKAAFDRIKEAVSRAVISRIVKAPQHAAAKRAKMAPACGPNCVML